MRASAFQGQRAGMRRYSITYRRWNLEFRFTFPVRDHDDPSVLALRAWLAQDAGVTILAECLH